MRIAAALLLSLVAAVPVLAGGGSGGGSTYHGDAGAIADCRNRSSTDVDLELGAGWERTRCHPVCPRLAFAEELHCSEGHHERPTAEHHNSVHWGIGFLAFCLVMGAAAKMCIPSWIPYT